MFTEQTDRSIVHETDAIVADERLYRTRLFVPMSFSAIHLLVGRMDYCKDTDYPPEGWKVFLDNS